MLDVFILPTGRPYFDLIFAQVPGWPKPGHEIFAKSFTTSPGGSYNIAIALHKLELEIGFCAHLGTDFFSGYLRQAALDAGMNTAFFIEHNEPMAAVTASISRFDDRGFVSYVDPIPDFDPEHLPNHGNPNVIFVPGIPDEPQQLFEYLDARKKTGSLLVCDSAHVERDLDDEAVAGLIRRMDLFICNAREAQTLTNKSVVERAAMILSSLCPEVVIKLGADGALAMEGGLVLREKAMHIPVQDTTGAGDGFNAGYIYGLVEGMLIERRLRLGNVVGGCFASGLGSTNAPSLDKMLEMERQHYGG